MRGLRGTASLFLGLALALSTAPPALAEDPPSGQGNAVITVDVTGYTGGSWGPIFGTIGCEGLPWNIEFGIPPSDGASSAPIEIPVGLPCQLSDVWGDDPGANAQWGAIDFDAAWWTLEDGDWKHLTVTIERAYAGPWPPETDDSPEIRIDLLTVDRVFLNRYGGITAEGRVACLPAAIAPDDGMIFVNVNWDALQYVGRKTALRASYQSVKAELCWEPGMTAPDTWQTYPRFTPEPGVAWIYSPDGKFGSGSIHFEVYATGGYTVVRQGFDAASDLAPYSEGCPDYNMDGFCVTSYFYSGWNQADLKPIVEKTPRR